MGTTALVWSWIAAPGLAATVLLLVLALVILTARAGHRQNQLLALVLLLEAMIRAGGEALMYTTNVAAETVAWQLVNQAAALAVVPAYLLFLATLETSWVTWLRGAWVQRTLWGAMALLPWAVGLWPARFVARVHPWAHSPWQIAFGPYSAVLVVFLVAAFVFGFVAALGAYLHARPGSPARARARAYTWAFGVRDLGTALLFLTTLAGVGPAGELSLIVLPPVVTFVFGPLLAYGLLRHQLFGLELKVKLAVRGSTVAAALAGVFFIIAEVAEQALGLDGVLQGVLAAAVIVAVLSPVQRLARRAADTLMPGVEDTPAYHDHRAVELYEAAVEGAARDGVVTRSERDVLDALRDRLGLAPITAHEIEARVAGAAPDPTTTP